MSVLEFNALPADKQLQILKSIGCELIKSDGKRIILKKTNKKSQKQIA